MLRKGFQPARNDKAFARNDMFHNTHDKPHFFPNVKNTFFAENTHNIKIRNTRIPIYISANTKEFNIKKLKEDVNSVYKQKRNKLIKQLENLDKDYKKFLEKYNNTNKLLDLVQKTKLKSEIEVII